MCPRFLFVDTNKSAHKGHHPHSHTWSTHGRNRTLTGDLKFVLVMWFGMRIFALWVNMIQNYWTHTRTFGYRRYNDDDDNAMNIGEWLPVTSTFSACLQNNHHHYPGLLRLSHDKSEYDFGFVTVKVMKYFGLVKATRTGEEVPKGVPLGALDF